MIPKGARGSRIDLVELNIIGHFVPDALALLVTPD